MPLVVGLDVFVHCWRQDASMLLLCEDSVFFFLFFIPLYFGNKTTLFDWKRSGPKPSPCILWLPPPGSAECQLVQQDVRGLGLD